MPRLIVLTIFFSVYAQAAPLRFVPQILVQPNGDTIHAYASGDEYNSWLHDKDEFTIVQDPVSGYYTYAVRMKTGSGIGASKFIVGKADPAQSGLEKNVTISPDAMEQKRRAEIQSLPFVAQKSASTTGTINNIVIFIRFADDYEFDTPVSRYFDAFNASAPGVSSLRNYFFEASYQQLTVTSTFYPLASGHTVSYQDVHPRAYFRPYNAVTNPNGYSTAAGSPERKVREHALLKDAIESVRSSIPADLNIDADNDGTVDNIVFVIKGPAYASDALLWPHKLSLWNFYVTINGKHVVPYNLQLEDATVGTFCHEFFHSLGANDLYRYPDLSTQPGVSAVGSWDLMCTHTATPAHMCAYSKYVYGKWISDIPEITTTGIYSIAPAGTSKHSCYKIRSMKSKDDYYIVEYRRREGIFERNLPAQGLLVYKVFVPLEGRGNYTGPPDELYLFRPGGTISKNGVPDSAALSAESGRTEMNYWSTDPAVFLSDSSQGDLIISDVSAADETISFKVWVIEDSLFAGSVNKSSGTTADAYKFSVWYKSVTPPGSLVLSCGGRTYEMIPGGSIPSDSINYTKTVYLPAAGTYPFFFTALVNGKSLRYPPRTDSLPLTVSAPPVTSDIVATVLTTSKAPLKPGDNFSAKAIVKNIRAASHQQIRNVRYTFSLLDPLGNKVDERSGTIADIVSDSAVIITSAPDFSLPSFIGNYVVTLSLYADGNGAVPSHSISRSFYVGQSPAQNQYVVLSQNGRVRLTRVDSVKHIADARWCLAKLEPNSISLRKDDADPLLITQQDFAWYDGQNQIVMCEEINGEDVVVSVGTHVVTSFVQFDRVGITCQRGGSIQFTASVHGVTLGRTNPQIYKNSTVAAWPSQVQYSKGDSVAKFTLWVPLDAPPGNHQFFLALDVAPGNAQVLQGLQVIVNGVWTQAGREIVANTNLPREYSLAQNFPNPFNPSTTISFSVPSRSFVSLKIYDVMGREVDAIASDEMPAGKFSRQWNASAFPSGVYFYRLQAGGYSETKRLVLVR